MPPIFSFSRPAESIRVLADIFFDGFLKIHPKPYHDHLDSNHLDHQSLTF